MAVPNRLQTLRLQAGMTQGQLAGAISGDRTAVSRWESCTHAIPDESKIALAAVLGVTVADLMGWEAARAGEAA